MQLIYYALNTLSLYSEHCLHYTIHCIIYTEQCIVYIYNYRVYNIYYIWCHARDYINGALYCFEIVAYLFEISNLKLFNFFRLFKRSLQLDWKQTSRHTHARRTVQHANASNGNGNTCGITRTHARAYVHIIVLIFARTHARTHEHARKHTHIHHHAYSRL